jgi:hypothetical protein
LAWRKVVPWVDSLVEKTVDMLVLSMVVKKVDLSVEPLVAWKVQTMVLHWVDPWGHLMVDSMAVPLVPQSVQGIR